MLWKGFQKPKRLANDASSLTDKYGMFWAQPFERGFGTTKACCTSFSPSPEWSRMRRTSS
jgi:hypothetical protein